jgi:hypothetical protein
MQDIPEELLVPPSPLVALFGDAPFLDVLCVCLKTAAPGAALSMRYEPAPLPLRFPPKARTHADAEYASYVPDGVLRRGWLERLHNGAPAVLVRGGGVGAPGGGGGRRQLDRAPRDH